MSKLICDFAEFNSKKNKISNLTKTYNSLVGSIIVNSMGIESFWYSESQKAFHALLIQRKAELDKLSDNLDEINNFLNEVITTYENIEGKYS